MPASEPTRTAAWAPLAPALLLARARRRAGRPAPDPLVRRALHRCGRPRAAGRPRAGGAVRRGHGAVPRTASRRRTTGPTTSSSTCGCCSRRFGADDVGLRLLSLLAAVGAVAVLTRAVQRLAGPAVGLAAGLLVAANPLVVEYAAEARGYGLALLATATALLGLARWLDGGACCCTAAGAAAMGLAHWFALPALAGLALGGRCCCAAAPLRPLVVVTGLAVLPTAALVVLAVVNGAGGDNVGFIRDTGVRLPWLARAGVDGRLGACCSSARSPRSSAGLRRGGRAAVVAGAWVGVPLLAADRRAAGASGVRPALPAAEPARARGARRARDGRRGGGRWPSRRRRAARGVAVGRPAAARPRAARGRAGSGGLPAEGVAPGRAGGRRRRAGRARAGPVRRPAGRGASCSPTTHRPTRRSCGWCGRSRRPVGWPTRTTTSSCRAGACGWCRRARSPGRTRALVVQRWER